MPGSGSAAPKATRNNLSEKQRHRLVEHLLKGSKNGKLARGDLKKAAADFSCSYEQVTGVWKRYKQQTEDGADVNLRNGRFGHSGRRGVDVEKANEALKTIPMKNRTTMRALAYDARALIVVRFFMGMVLRASLAFSTSTPRLPECPKRPLRRLTSAPSSVCCL